MQVYDQRALRWQLRSAVVKLAADFVERDSWHSRITTSTYMYGYMHGTHMYIHIHTSAYTCMHVHTHIYMPDR